MEIKEVIHKNLDPLKIILQKSHASGFNWEIHIQGRDLAEILPKLREANSKLKGEYGGQETNPSFSNSRIGQLVEEISHATDERGLEPLVDQLYHELFEQEA
ncbi:Uncharacterised protein [uncultured archaeon]|nr:Uncharacterised protein [uncultured archaeon]